MINVVSETKEMKYTHNGINIGSMPLNRLSILVNDELGEVPLNEAAKENQTMCLTLKSVQSYFNPYLM